MGGRGAGAGGVTRRGGPQPAAGWHLHTVAPCASAHVRPARSDASGRGPSLEPHHVCTQAAVHARRHPRQESATLPAAGAAGGPAGWVCRLGSRLARLASVVAESWPGMLRCGQSGGRRQRRRPTPGGPMAGAPGPCYRRRQPQGVTAQVSQPNDRGTAGARGTQGPRPASCTPRRVKTLPPCKRPALFAHITPDPRD